MTDTFDTLDSDSEIDRIQYGDGEQSSVRGPNPLGVETGSVLDSADTATRTKIARARRAYYADLASLERWAAGGFASSYDSEEIEGEY